jgi:type I restriction enzyme, S subunit
MSIPMYARYKGSGVEWLGQVPEHWPVKRIKHLIRSLDQGWSPQCESSPAKSFDEWAVLKVGCVNGSSFQPAENKALPADLEPVPALGVAAGDVLISRANTRELVGRAAVALRDYPKLMVCDKLYRIRPSPLDCKSEFLASYLGTRLVRGQIELSATGASSSMLNIGQDTILDMPIAVPPLAEQLNIISFLDRETVKIDALIDEQRRLIGLLREKRQAVISHAVTKGLDPTAPMKDSDVEWLGELPEHWAVVNLCRVADPHRPITYGIVQPGASDPNGRYMVRGQDYSNGWADPAAIFRVSATVEEPYRRARLRAGDVIMTIVGAGTGNTAIVPSHLDGANITQTTARIAPARDRIEGNFLSWALCSSIGRTQVQLFQKGAAQPGLNLEHLKAFRVPLPPRSEQHAITIFLYHETEKIDELAKEAQRAIALLQERRTALISAAVTGKIDVRGTIATKDQAA